MCGVLIFSSSCIQRCTSQAIHSWDTSPSACSPLTMTWHFFLNRNPGCLCSPLHPSPPHSANLGTAGFIPTSSPVLPTPPHPEGFLPLGAPIPLHLKNKFCLTPTERLSSITATPRHSHPSSLPCRVLALRGSTSWAPSEIGGEKKNGKKILKLKILPPDPSAPVECGAQRVCPWQRGLGTKLWGGGGGEGD